MAYLTEAYLQAALGTTKVAKLCPGTTGPTLATLIAQATAATRSALSIGGYADAVPETVYASDATDCPDEIKLTALGAFIELAYGANDLEIPKAYAGYIAQIEEVKTGKLEIASVTRSTRRGVGGVSFTESSTSVSVDNGSRPQVFSRKAMQGF